MHAFFSAGYDSWRSRLFPRLPSPSEIWFPLVLENSGNLEQNILGLEKSRNSVSGAVPSFICIRNTIPSEVLVEVYRYLSQDGQ